MNIAITNLQKADCFASIFQHIKLLTDNINIMFEEERMYLQCMDSARVSIFEITIPKTWFDEYTHSVPGGKTIGISSSILISTSILPLSGLVEYSMIFSSEHLISMVSPNILSWFTILAKFDEGMDISAW